MALDVFMDRPSISGQSPLPGVKAIKTAVMTTGTVVVAAVAAIENVVISFTSCFHTVFQQTQNLCLEIDACEKKGNLCIFGLEFQLEWELGLGLKLE